MPIEARHKEMERILSISDPYVIRLMNESRMPLVGCLKPLLEDDFRGLPHRLALSSKYFDHARKQHIKDYVPEIYNLIKRFYNEIPYPRSSRRGFWNGGPTWPCFLCSCPLPPFRSL